MHPTDTPAASATRFDLIDIVQALRRNARLLLLFTLLAAVVGALAYFLSPRTYKASAEVFVTNPQYADRNRLFAGDQTYYIDYFADENTNDRALVIAKSDNARSQIVFRNKLNEVYELDTSKMSDEAKLGKRFKAAYEAKRTEYGSLLISFTDKSPQRAADVANDAVAVIEMLFHGYFSQMRQHIVGSLQETIKNDDSTIAGLTDSLVAMRGRGSDGRALEDLKGVESLKNQYVADRARHTSLVGEFSIGIRAGDLPILQVMSPAYVPEIPTGLGAPLTILACALGGFLVAVLWILLSTYFRQLAAVRR